MAHDLILGNVKRRFSRDDETNQSGFFDEDPILWTSDSAKAEFNRIRIVLDTVNSEMSQAASDGKITNNEWLRWRDLYQSAHKLVGQSTWFSVSKGDIVIARKMEQDAKKWHDLLMSRKVTPVGPSQIFREPPDPSTDWKFGFNLPTIGLMGGSVFVVGYLVNAIRRK